MEDPPGVPPVIQEQDSAPYVRPTLIAAPPVSGEGPGLGAIGRRPAPWILLILLFSFLIVGTLTDLRKPAIGGGDQYWEDVQAIKAAVHQKQITSLFPSARADAGAVPQENLVDLRAKAPKDPTAARLLVEAEYESGQNVSPADLDHVTASGLAVDKDFANIYRSKKLTLEQAQQLTSKFPESRYSYSLAKVHAFDKAGDPGPRKALSPAWKMVGMGLIAVGGFVGLGLGFLLWIGYFVLKADGRLPMPQHPAEPLSLGEADRFAYRAVLFIALFLLIGLGIQALPKTSVAFEMFAMYGAMLVGVVLLHKTPALGLRIPLSRIGVSTKDLAKNVGWGVVGYLMALPGLAVALIVGIQLMKVFGKSTHPATELATSNPTVATALALYFSASMVAPFWEEIMFRGTLLPALSRVLGKPVWGILLSSFMFAAIHPQGVPLWLALGFIGAMNGMLAYQTRSLVPCMVLHALNNGVVLTLALLMS
jgi:membrane protease YdiL (CAAX protease family)